MVNAVSIEKNERLFAKIIKKNSYSVYGWNIRRDDNDQFICVTENWMRESYDDRVKEWWPLKYGILIVKLEDDAVVADQDIAKSINQMRFYLGSYKIAHSKRLVIKVIREINGFYTNNLYNGDTDSAYIHKRHWSTLVDKGYIGKSRDLERTTRMRQVYFMLVLWLRK